MKIGGIEMFRKILIICILGFIFRPLINCAKTDNKTDAKTDNKTDDKNCCKMYSYMNDSINEACDKQYPKNLCAVVTCNMVKMNMMADKSNTTISKSALDNFVKNVSETDWAVVFGKALDNCWSSMGKIKKDLEKKYSAAPFNVSKEACSYEALFFANCFALVSVYNCPKPSRIANATGTNCESLFERGGNQDVLVEDTYELIALQLAHINNSTTQKKI